MRFSQLAGQPIAGDDPDITGLTADSRAVKPGYLFAALPGVKADGAQFVKDAIAKGAVALIGGETIRAAAGDLPFIATANPRKQLAVAAAAFYVRQPDTMVAVTGTNGKTSVASFVRQIWAALGHASASFGTVGVVSPHGTKPLSHTTPDPVEIHRLLDELPTVQVQPATGGAVTNIIAVATIQKYGALFDTTDRRQGWSWLNDQRIITAALNCRERTGRRGVVHLFHAREVDIHICRRRQNVITYFASARACPRASRMSIICRSRRLRCTWAFSVITSFLW